MAETNDSKRRRTGEDPVTMQITVMDEQSDAVVSIDIDESDDVGSLKALVEVQTGVTTSMQVLLHNGAPLANDSVTIASAGISNGDLLLLRRQQHQSAGSSGPAAGADAGAGAGTGAGPDLLSDVDAFIRQVNSQPALLAQISRQNPVLASAIRENRRDVVQQMLALAVKRREEANSWMNLDPMSPEYQQRAMEAIQQQNIAESMSRALEEIPESFAHVVMLYIDAELNDVPIKAFVDSGAQSSIISKNMAEKCNVMRLCDQRFQGIAKGVGQAKILGRIHMAQLKLGSSYFPISLMVIDDPNMDFLFGLDMLQRHQCCIDLKINALRIGDEEVKFLPEKDIPKHMRGATQEPQAMSPGGSSGAAVPDPRMAAAAAAAARQGKATAPAAAQSSNSAPVTFPEADIESLVALGFPRDKAIKALQMCGGNVERAASLLFSQ